MNHRNNYHFEGMSVWWNEPLRGLERIKSQTFDERSLEPPARDRSVPAYFFSLWSATRSLGPLPVGKNGVMNGLALTKLLAAATFV